MCVVTLEVLLHRVAESKTRKAYRVYIRDFQICFVKDLVFHSQYVRDWYFWSLACSMR